MSEPTLADVRKDNALHKELIRQHQQGDKNATDLLLRVNKPILFTIAKRFKHYRSDLADLIQEGNLGLLRAWSDYDPSFGTNPLTYAHYWIFHYMIRYLGKKGSVVATPANVFRARTRKVYTFTEMSDRMHKFHENAFEETLTSDETPADEVLNDRGLQVQIPSITEILLAELSLKEQEILIRHIYKDETLADIGRDYGVSRERIRQLEAVALRKLFTRYQVPRYWENGGYYAWVGNLAQTLDPGSPQ